MNLKISVIGILALTLLLSASASAQAPAASAKVDSIIHEIDRLYRANSSYSEIEMEIVTPHWQRTLSMVGWSEGMKKTFIRITSPAKEKGVTTLRMGNEMWNYLPKTNKVIKIPPSMMMSSWMGSDFTNDDLVKEFSLYEDYKYSEITPDSAIDSLIYINCVPSPDLPVVWGNVVIAATRDSYLPVWEKYYDEKGTLMRVMYFSDIRTFGDRTIPATMEMVPQNKEGHRTVIRYLKIDYNIPVDEEIFSLRNLRSQ
jgi:outer membrane lipoprotein-sorting protein